MLNVVVDQSMNNVWKQIHDDNYVIESLKSFTKYKRHKMFWY